MQDQPGRLEDDEVHSPRRDASAPSGGRRPATAPLSGLSHRPRPCPTLQVSH